jgi:molybdopterin converting factor small subunit
VKDVARVRVLGTVLRALCGGRELCVEADRVGELLLELCARGSTGLVEHVFADAEAERRSLHPDLRVLVNGRDVRFLEGLDTALAASDAVTLHQAGARSFPGG